MKKQAKIGLKDRSGNEIREGDILFCGMRRGDPNGWSHEIVAWNAKNKEYDLVNRSMSLHMQMQRDSELRIIRGNIYEHPDLIKFVSL